MLPISCFLFHASSFLFSPGHTRWVSKHGLRCDGDVAQARVACCRRALEHVDVNLILCSSSSSSSSSFALAVGTAWHLAIVGRQWKLAKVQIKTRQ
jgi:hypothetical protein